MLKQNWRIISLFERIGDFAIIVMCFFAAYHGRDSLVFWNDRFGWHLPFMGDQLAPLKDYFIVLAVSLLGYWGMLSMLGAYSSMRLSSSFQLLKISLVSSVVVFFLLAAALFLLKIDLSRSFVALFCVLVCFSLAAERYVVLAVLRYWRRKGKNFRNIIICGVGEQALKVAREIAAMPELGLRIRAFAQLDEEKDPDSLNLLRFKSKVRSLSRSPAGARTPIGRVIQGRSAFGRAIEEYAIDEVIFTDVVDVMPHVEEAILVCSEQGIRTTLVADLFSIGMVKSGLSYFGDMPLIHFQTPPGDRWELFVKRILDIAVALLLLSALVPVFLIVALLIKVSSRGPVLFVQKRMGLNGRIFDMYKFRSMYVDADKDLHQLKERNEMKGPVFKMKNDPRITPVGRFLRRFSLDELPQLWNVMKGDMSLVGPRPPVPGEVSMYERKDRRRLSMRPGLTCTWQVSGRNNISDFTSWVELDLDYIDNWSLGRDFILLLRTIPAVLLGTGAR